eukprot:300851_1
MGNKSSSKQKQQNTQGAKKAESDKVEEKVTKTEINNKTKYSVYGFIREIEKSFKLTTVIPQSIIKICILFFMQTEYFAKCGRKMIITGTQNDTLKTTERSFYRCAAFGANWIPSNRKSIIMWTVKMIKNPYGHAGGVIIGIISKDVDMNQYIHNNKNAFPSYFFAYQTSIFQDGEDIKLNYGKEYAAEGSVLKMVLNLKTKELIDKRKKLSSKSSEKSHAKRQLEDTKKKWNIELKKK